MVLNKEQREWIASDLVLLSNWQVVEFIEGRASNGFGSRLQQARNLRECIERRWEITQSLEKRREANLICDSIFHLDQAIKMLAMAEEEGANGK